DTDNKSSTMVGTPFCMAPEIIKNEPYGARSTFGHSALHCQPQADSDSVVEMIEKEPTCLDHLRNLRKVMDLIVTNGTPTFKNPELLSRKLKSFFAVCPCVHVDSPATARELLLDHEFMKKPCTAAELRPLLQFNVPQST
ncbi:hypothetical protein B0H11DRAFT_1753108, partial [Mycena galericulata]